MAVRSKRPRAAPAAAKIERGIDLGGGRCPPNIEPQTNFSANAAWSVKDSSFAAVAFQSQGPVGSLSVGQLRGPEILSNPKITGSIN